MWNLAGDILIGGSKLLEFMVWARTFRSSFATVFVDLISFQCMANAEQKCKIFHKKIFNNQVYVLQTGLDEKEYYIRDCLKGVQYQKIFFSIV